MSRQKRRSGWIDPFWLPLHVAGLVCLGLSHPLLDLVGRHPTFLDAWGLDGADLVGLALAIAWLPAALAFLTVHLLVRLSGGAGTERAESSLAILAAVPLAIVGGVLSLGFASRLWATGPAWVVAVAGGVAISWLYPRKAGIRWFLGALALILVLSPALFLLRTDVASRLVGHSAFDSVAEPVGNPEPVVLLLFDEFPSFLILDPESAIEPSADAPLSVDRERFPNLAQLAETSDFFPYAYAADSLTKHAVPSLFAGRYSDIDRQGDSMARCNILPRLVGSYELTVNELFTNLAPPGAKSALPEHRERGASGLVADLVVVYLHWLLPSSLRDGLPPIDNRWAGFGAEETYEELPVNGGANGSVDAGVDGGADPLRRNTPRFHRFLDGLEPPGTRPAFVFHHSLLPHVPWYLLPTGQSYPNPLARREYIDVWMGHQATLEGRSRLELQAQAVDHLVGRLVRRLRESRRFDDSWLIVTADHGVIFEDGVYFRATSRFDLAASSALPVPLLVKRPGQREGRTIDRYVETVDLAPTLAEALELSLPCPSDGRSLYDPAERSFDETVLARRFGHEARTIDEVKSALRDEVRHHREELWGTPAQGPYRPGPYGRLVGLEAGPTGEPLSWVVELDSPRFYDDVNPDASIVPVRVVGSVLDLPEPAADGPHLALATGGRIVATTRIRRVRSESVFAALIDPQLLTAGRMDFQFYGIAGPVEAPVLRPVRVHSRSDRLRSEFEASDEVVLRQGKGHGFEALRETSGVERLHGDDGVFRFHSETMNPYLVFDLDRSDALALNILVDLSVPDETELQVWFAGRDEPFAPLRSETIHVESGGGRVQFVIESTTPVGKLRIDPGALPGEYEIRSIEARKVDRSADE